MDQEDSNDDDASAYPMNIQEENKQFIHFLQKIWNKGDILYPDIIIDINGKKYLCHRMILASFSGYFKNIIENSDGLLEIVVTLDDVSDSELAFASILQFMYTKFIKLSREKIKDIYNTSVFLEISILRRECEKVLTRWFQEDTLTQCHL